MEKLVLVGNGMAGIGCLEQILKHGRKFDITVFGDETHVNYNRIMLSSVLAGEKREDEIMLNDLDWYRQNEIDLRLGVRIIDIDPVAKTVTGDDGSVTRFDKLLLATGSQPLIPSIEDVKKVCASGFTMPQKSTYFYPKAICGFLFSTIKEDEFQNPECSPF